MSVRDRTLVSRRQPLLDVVAEVLVANPSASLAEVAEAAGIGRTTLHKHYATRDELIRAVGYRALDLWELAFLWRTPAFDHVSEIGHRWGVVEKRSIDVLQRAQAAGHVAPDIPEWWLLSAFHALIYSGAEGVRSGHLAPRYATEMVLRTLLHGIGR